MDLVTLIAMCSLGYNAELMHGLIAVESGAEPWSYRVEGESKNHVFMTMEDALTAAIAKQDEGHDVRVGLTGIAVDLRAATADPPEGMFEPCPNIVIASQQLSERAITVEELMDADEIFTSGNYGKVMPITRIEGRDLQPGPVYSQARKSYWDWAHGG